MMAITMNFENQIHMLVDENLSYKEIGLLITLFNAPDDCNVSIDLLASLHRDGRDSVARSMNSLIEKGYIFRKRVHQDNAESRRMEMIYEIYSDPINNSHFSEKII